MHVTEKLQITSRFTRGFYGGSEDRAVSAPNQLVPGKFNVAINGRPYMLDQANDAYGDVSIPRTRVQADSSTQTSELSLNPEGLWRRSIETIHRGAGQRYYDMPDSVRDRYWASDGVDPWTRGTITLLSDTDKKRTSANSVLDLEVCGARLYLLDGDELRYTEDVTPDGPSFTDVSPVDDPDGRLTDARSIAADGKNVYALDGTDLYYTANNTVLYQTATGGDDAAIPGDLVRYVKGRLFVLDDNSWVEMVGEIGTLTPRTVFVHPNADFAWVDMAGGPTHIYAAGFSGDKSLVYRTGILDDASELSAPVVCVSLPSGEVIRSLEIYLNFLLIGTDAGLRFALIQDNGAVTLGQLLPLSNAVRCFEGQDRFVWFGWSNFTDEKTGLGRLDMSILNDGLPAYASDLMARDIQGAVLDVVVFQGRPVFVVDGDGMWAEADDKVPSGTIDFGLMSFGITEQKTALFLDTQWKRSEGLFLRHFSVDEEGFHSVAGNEATSLTRGGDSTVSLSEQRGRLFEVRYELFRAPGDATAAPQLSRATLRVQNAARPGVRRRWPLQLHKQVITADDGEWDLDVQAERDFLEDLHRDTRVVTAQEGRSAFTVILEEFEWHPLKNDPYGPNGTFICVLKDID